MEKEITTYTSILALEIPWTEEPGRMKTMGSQTVGHDSEIKQKHQCQEEHWP